MVYDRGPFSPSLFNLYIDGLLTQLSFSGLGARIAYLCLGCLTYADDITLVSPNVAGLQQMLDICTTYANKHHLIYNTKQSVVITFKQRRWKHSSKLDVFLIGNRLPNKKEITHLGVFMNGCCMVQSTLEAAKRKFYAAVKGVIIQLGGSCPKDSVWMTIMERQLFPVLAYKSHLWNFERSIVETSVNTAYRKDIRRGLGMRQRDSIVEIIPEFVEASLKMKILQTKFFKRVIDSRNELVRELALLIVRHSYPGLGLDIVDGNVFMCILSDFVC